MNPYFPLGIAALGLVAYLAYKKTKAETVTKTDPVPENRTIRHMGDYSDEWCNPLNVTTNLAYVDPLYREPGPYGVERVMYGNSGDATFPTYGNAYRTL